MTDEHLRGMVWIPVAGKPIGDWPEWAQDGYDFVAVYDEGHVQRRLGGFLMGSESGGDVFSTTGSDEWDYKKITHVMRIPDPPNHVCYNDPCVL